MRTIVLPVDGSVLAESALAHAVGWAGRSGARLVMISVQEALPPRPGALPDEWSEPAELYLKALARRLNAELRLVQGNPAGQILSLATELGTDLIVMGTHGSHGISRWMIGSVADKVMRHAPCPVLLVRPPRVSRQSIPEQIERALMGEWPRYSGVLLPLDGSALSERSLPPACWLAGHDASRLTLLRVHDFPGSGLEPQRPGLWTDLVQSEVQAQQQRYLSERVAEIRSLGVEARQQCLHGCAAERILEQELDLTIMASHTRSGFFGSVASRVVHRACAPVLVLRGEGALMEHGGTLGSWHSKSW